MESNKPNNNNPFNEDNNNVKFPFPQNSISNKPQIQNNQNRRNFIRNNPPPPIRNVNKLPINNNNNAQFNNPNALFGGSSENSNQSSSIFD